MIDEEKDKGAAQTGKTEEMAGNDGAPFPNAEAANDEGTPAEADVLLKLVKENEELKDRALRLAAEMENLRRRTARDVVEARNYSIANFARDMLTVSDNLRRGLEAVPPEAHESGESGLKALVEGVEMTERAMLSALERHGVRKLEPKGEKFDPHFHQAMFEVEDGDVAPGTVVQVVQTGFVIGERVLRPALVGVAKAGRKADAPEAAPGGKAEPGARGPYNDREG